MEAEVFALNPLRMGGMVKEASGAFITVHLHGRLGVLTVPAWFARRDGQIEIGQSLQFYFSYLQVVEMPCVYDTDVISSGGEAFPCLLGGVITQVNDTAVKADILHQLGSIAVPRRWVFTDRALKEGQQVAFYLSLMHPQAGRNDSEKENGYEYYDSRGNAV